MLTLIWDNSAASVTDPVMVASRLREYYLDRIDDALSAGDRAAHFHFGRLLGIAEWRFVVTVPTTSAGARRKLEWAAVIASGSAPEFEDLGDAVEASMDAAAGALGSEGALSAVEMAVALAARQYGRDDQITAAAETVAAALRPGARFA